MKSAITIVNIVSACVLIVSILLQQRGSGLGAVFGGEGSIYRTKRGIEKILFFASIVLAVLFFGSSFALLII